MSAPVLFVSDLHLDAARPQATAAFQRFLAGPARDAQALYILGDLFEAWLGDDDDSALAAAISNALRALADRGVHLYFLRGNRDFLLGADYAARCGMRLLPDPCVVMLQGTPTLLMHGDLLCTADRDYQRFRAMVRAPQWQTQFLAQQNTLRISWKSSMQTNSNIWRQNSQKLSVNRASNQNTQKLSSAFMPRSQPN